MIRALAALAVIAATLAATQTHTPKAAATVGTWNVVSSEMNANLATGQFSVPVPLTMTRSDGSTVQGDRAVGNFKLKRIALYGNVSVHDVSGSFGLQSGGGAQGRGPSTLTSDELLVNDKTHLYDARGHVHYEQGDTKVDSQTAHLNDKTHQLALNGTVHIVQADRLLDADSATYNTQTGAGVAQTNVRMEFPGAAVEIATPKPITVKGPKIPR